MLKIFQVLQVDILPSSLVDRRLVPFLDHSSGYQSLLSVGGHHQAQFTFFGVLTKDVGSDLKTGSIVDFGQKFLF